MRAISASFWSRPRALGLVAAVVVLCSCATPGVQPKAAQLPSAPPPSGQEVRDLLQSARFAELDQRFSAIQLAYKSGAATDENLRAAYRVFYDSDPALGPEYDLWVSKFPKSYAARLARGIYYAKVGQELRGNQTISETPDKQLELADVAYHKAKTDLYASIGLDRKPLLSYVHAMTVSQENGDLAESRRLLDQAIQIDPNNYIARVKYMTVIETRWGGSQEMMQAFLDECRHAKLSAMQLQVIVSVAIENQGWVRQYVDKDYAAAEAAYRQSAALGGDPQWANLSDVLLRQGKYKEAIEPLTELLQIRPNDLNTLVTRGDAYLQIGQPREGLADLMTAAQAGNAGAQNNLGRLYMMGIPGVLTPNMQTAFEWFRKSAAQGNAAGQQNLATALKMYGAPQADGSSAGIRSGAAIAETQTADIPVPPRSPQAWALATTAILFEANGARNDLLGGAVSTPAAAASVRELLSQWWGVTNRDQLLANLQLLQFRGHRADFDELGRQVDAMSEQQFMAAEAGLAGDTEQLQKLRVVRQNYRSLGPSGILAWDIVRYIALCRWGFEAGYLSQTESWDRIMPAALRLQDSFTSWQALQKDYLIGREYWSANQTGTNGNRFQAISDRLFSDPNSPWNVNPWTTNLGIETPLPLH